MSRNNKDRLGVSTPDVQTANPPITPTDQNQAVFNFTTPTEFVELPSGGRFYDEEHPLHNEETVEIKFMTAKEEDILTSPSLLKKGLAIDRLLQSVVINKGIDLDSLLVGDKNALLVATRVTGYGPDYSTNVTCPACSTSSKYEFDLSDIPGQPGGVSTINSEHVTESDRGTFFITGLERTKAKVEVRLLRGHDEKMRNSRMKKKKKHSITTSAFMEMLSSFIVSVNDSADPNYIASFLENMPAMDSRHLRATYSTLIPNVDLNQEFECEACGTTTEMEVPLNAEFFWPR
jgi:hypothetical protein